MTSDDTARLSPLDDATWSYVEKQTLEDFDAGDWARLNGQRVTYMADRQAEQALRLLTVGKDDTTFGYRINNYRHCLQSATMVMRAGLDEETIVVALFHDIGFVACPDTHGDFAAGLLGAYISERNAWMLRHHAVFQNAHVSGYPGLDPDARDRWRGHPHFDWTAEFVAKFDQNAIDPDYETAPVETFEPLVHRLFARPPAPPDRD